jgi:hypothetical protein
MRFLWSVTIVRQCSRDQKRLCASSRSPKRGAAGPHPGSGFGAGYGVGCGSVGQSRRNYDKTLHDPCAFCVRNAVDGVALRRVDTVTPYQGFSRSGRKALTDPGPGDGAVREPLLHPKGPHWGRDFGVRVIPLGIRAAQRGRQGCESSLNVLSPSSHSVLLSWHKRRY